MGEMRRNVLCFRAVFIPFPALLPNEVGEKEPKKQCPDVVVLLLLRRCEACYEIPLSPILLATSLLCDGIQVLCDGIDRSRVRKNTIHVCEKPIHVCEKSIHVCAFSHT